MTIFRLIFSIRSYDSANDCRFIFFSFFFRSAGCVWRLLLRSNRRCTRRINAIELESNSNDVHFCLIFFSLSHFILRMIALQNRIDHQHEWQ